MPNISFLKVEYKNLNHNTVSVVMAIHNPVTKRPLLLKDFNVFISWTTLTIEGNKLSGSKLVSRMSNLTSKYESVLVPGKYTALNSHPTQLDFKLLERDSTFFK